MARLRRSWTARVAVEGNSMRPTLHAGDWLLVDPDGYRDVAPEVGDLVLVPDPRLPERLLVKRVATVSDGGRDLFVTGDAPASSTDSRAFGGVDVADVRGRPWFRYWPISRWGRLR